MSLFFCAAPVEGFVENNNNANNNANNDANKNTLEKMKKNRTIKRKQKSSLEKSPQVQNIEQMIERIHNKKEGLADEDEGDELEQFSNFSSLLPPPKVQNKVNNPNISSETPTPPSTNNDDNAVSPSDYSDLQSVAGQQYYQQYVPYFNNMSNPPNPNRDELMDKLNRVIQLLEDQHDEKTGHVSEELVLYCFLGVFVIFIIDSFARASKYVR